MRSYRCPGCGGMVPESDLRPDPVSGQPMHTVPAARGRGADRFITSAERSGYASCGPVAMTLQDKERWGRDTAFAATSMGSAEHCAVGTAVDVSVLIPDRRFSRRDLRADRMVSGLGS